MNRQDQKRNACLLQGPWKKRGYMRWWHSFVGKPMDSEAPERTFFIEYFYINPGLGGARPSIPSHPYLGNEGEKPSYVCVKAGMLPTATEPGTECNRYFPISAMKIANRPFYFLVEDCSFSETHCKGSIDATSRDLYTLGEDTIVWDLEIYKSIACHTGIWSHQIFQALNFFDSLWHGEGIKSAFRGTITVNDVVYQVTPESSYGYCDKHWGRDYNRPWVLFTSCKLYSEKKQDYLKHSAFVIKGCSPRFLWFSLPPRLSCQLTYTGEDFCFALSGFSLLSSCRYQMKGTNKRKIWHILAKKKGTLLKLSLHARKSELMPLYYETTLGAVRKSPLLTGGNGIGYIELYRYNTNGSRELLDTLKIEQALCQYQAAGSKKEQ